MKTAQKRFLAAVAFVLTLGCGSNAERDWSKCSPADSCKPGYYCTSDNRCLQQTDAYAAPDTALDGVAATPDAAVASVDAFLKVDSHVEPDAPIAPDAPVVSVAIDAPMAPDLAKDTFVEECRSSAECKEPARGFCVGGVCTGCDQAGYGACPGKVCAPAGTPLVGGQCVACVTSAHCTSPTAPICVGNACVACSSPGQCSGKDTSAPACLAETGACVACINDTTCPAGGFSHCDTKSHTCVGCSTSVDCTGSTPICTAGVCGKCTTSSQCAGRDPNKPMCTNDGCVQCSNNTDCAGVKDKPLCDPASKTCVACLTSQNCPEATPICEGNVCLKCTAASGKCSSWNPAKPACASGGTCVQCTATSNTCSGTTPACNDGAGLCVQCIDGSTCGGTTPVCDVETKTCVGCLASATCSNAATPVCDTKLKKCVECLDDKGCTGPTKPFCTNGTCTACTVGDRCKNKNASTPACALSGSQAGACVQCTDTSACIGTPATPICDTSSNKCVACLTSPDCKDATKPICGSDNQCRACTSVGSECSAKNSGLPVCASTGACVQCAGDGNCSGMTSTTKCKSATNTCVQCLDNSHCSGSKPICGPENACQACTSDAQCTGIGPGVCMYHQDGRCASAEETFVATNIAGLPTVESLGAKKLVVVRVGTSGSTTWDLTGKPEISIVGQNGMQKATIQGNHTDPTLSVENGNVYLRNVALRDGNPGLLGLGGGVLRLDEVEVSSNDSDGIRIVAMAFDIRHTVIEGNTDCGISLRYLAVLASGPTSLMAATVIGNAGGGVCCTTATDNPNPFQAVFVSNNALGDFGSSCSLTSCSALSSTCGTMAKVP